MEPPTRASALRRALAGLAALAAIGLAVYSALCLTARAFWLGELAACWRWYAGLGGLGLVTLLALARRRRAAVAALALSAWHLVPTLSLALPRELDGEPTGPALRVASANLLWRTRSNEVVREWLARERFDVVALQELDTTRFALLDALLAEYPHQLLSPRERADWRPQTWGLALLSRHKIESGAVHHGGWRGQPFVEARARVAGVPVTVLGAHAIRPGLPWRIAARDACLAALAERARGSPHTLVLGDLNATLYSPAFRDLLEVGELADSRAGFGRQGSWRAHGLLFGLALETELRLGIDHVLVGRGLEVRGRALGPELESDHRPVVAELALRADPAPQAAGINAPAAARCAPPR